jgi:hypothetical protein
MEITSTICGTFAGQMSQKSWFSFNIFAKKYSGGMVISKKQILSLGFFWKHQNLQISKHAKFSLCFNLSFSSQSHVRVLQA